MAAILCRTVNECIGAACTTLGKIVCFPCTACNVVSREICSNNNFIAYLLVTLGLNGVPLVLGIQANIEHGHECQSVLQWLAINSALSLINILAAVYIVATIGRSNQEHDHNAFHRMESGIYFNQSNTWSRVNQVVCYDPVVAVYLLFLAGFFVWHVLGGTRDCDDDAVMRKFYISLCFGWLFLVLGIVCFCCGVLCIRRT